MTKCTSIGRVALTACLIAAAVGFLEFLTRGKIGVSPDSISYLYAARTLANGKGALAMNSDGGDMPLTHFPPLLPCVLALGTKVGIDPLAFAKIVNAVFYAASLLLLMLLVYRETQSFAASSAAVALAGATGMIALIHSYVWSEPLFLLNTLLCVYFLVNYLSRGKLWILPLAGALASLAFLSRYVGLCLIPVGALVCLLRFGRPLTGRTFAATIFVVFAAAGPGIWSIRNHLAVGAATDRTFAWHPIPRDQWVLAARVAERVLPLPADLAGGGLILLAAVVVAGCSLLYRKQGSSPIGFVQRCPVVTVLLLTTLNYLLMVLISMSLFDAAISLEDRIIAPLAVFMVGILTISTTALLRHPGLFRYRKVIACALLSFTIIGGAVKSYRWFQVLDFGWVLKHGAHSQTLAALSSLPQKVDVYTNAQDGVWFLTGRRTRDLPYKISSISWLPLPGYAASLNELCRRVESGGAVIVFFDARAFREYLPTRSELETRLPALEKTYSDGAVFQAKGTISLPPGSK